MKCEKCKKKFRYETMTEYFTRKSKQNGYIVLWFIFYSIPFLNILTWIGAIWAYYEKRKEVKLK